MESTSVQIVLSSKRSTTVNIWLNFTILLYYSGNWNFEWLSFQYNRTMASVWSVCSKFLLSAQYKNFQPHFENPPGHSWHWIEELPKWSGVSGPNQILVWRRPQIPREERACQRVGFQTKEMRVGLALGSLLVGLLVQELEGRIWGARGRGRGRRWARPITIYTSKQFENFFQ